MKITGTLEAYREDESFEGDYFIMSSGLNLDDLEITTPEGKTYIVSAEDIQAMVAACRLASGKD